MRIRAGGNEAMVWDRGMLYFRRRGICDQKKEVRMNYNGMGTLFK